MNQWFIIIILKMDPAEVCQIGINFSLLYNSNNNNDMVVSCVKLE